MRYRRPDARYQRPIPDAGCRIEAGILITKEVEMKMKGVCNYLLKNFFVASMVISRSLRDKAEDRNQVSKAEGGR
jgi:hypothetical protein